jgi:hypothetical protein
LVILLQNQTVKRSLLAVLPLETGALFFCLLQGDLETFRLDYEQQVCQMDSHGEGALFNYLKLLQ